MNLSSDLTLLDWSGTAVQNGSIASIDEEAATVALTNLVPEPGTLAPAAHGATILTILLRRRSRPASSKAA